MSGRVLTGRGIYLELDGLIEHKEAIAYYFYFMFFFVCFFLAVLSSLW